MLPAISTQVFLPQALTPALLDALAATGARTIELEAARWHLNGSDRGQVREVAGWFAAHDVEAMLAAPAYFEADFSRHRTPSLNLLDLDRARRIAAMDEVKRALELGEQVKLQACVLPLGDRETRWSEATLDYALNAVDHLKAFAAPLGVPLLLVSAGNPFATPSHLLEVLRAGHFDTCGVMVEVAAAVALEQGLAETLEELGTRLRALRLSDRRDGGPLGERLWPESGNERPGVAVRGVLDWPEVYETLAHLPAETPGVVTVSDTQAGSPAEVTRLGQQVFSHQARLHEAAVARRESDAARGVNL